MSDKAELKPKERPILFNGDMVRAILEGRKTQTRRLVPEWQLPKKTMDGAEYISVAQRHPRWGFGVFGKTEAECMGNYNDQYSDLCPFGNRRERLWVRESWSCEYWLSEVKPSERLFAEFPGALTPFPPATWYWADGEPNRGDWEKPRPSIHMPRWASRITLEITGVRVERLQDISEGDAQAEGVARTGHDTAWKDYSRPGIYLAHAKDSFCSLWQSIYGAESWNSNPWMWVIEFTRAEQVKV